MTLPNTILSASSFPFTAVQVIEGLQAAGYQAYFVGGCVRDALRSLPSKDIDIASSAKPEEIKAIFDDVQFVGASFGVCIVTLDGHHFEVASFRKDGQYTDQRRPDSITFGTVQEDAMRRDFTFNAIYFNPLNGTIFDPYDGQKDLSALTLRAVGTPSDRFQEDPLRLLRAIRFAAKMEFTIEDETWRSICSLAPSIKAISAERQRDELTRMFMHDTAMRAITLLDESGLLVELLPEIVGLKGIQQGKHHREGDVFQHTKLCMGHLTHRNPISCWAMLLHDIGKPATFTNDDGAIHFYGHEFVGAQIAADILERFKFSNKDSQRIVDIITRHMMPFGAESWHKKTLRRFLASETIDEELALHYADCLSSWKDEVGTCVTATHEFLSTGLEGYRSTKQPILPPPLITGRDLIAMGYQPGPIFAVILNHIQEAQLDGQVADADSARALVTSTF